VAAIAAGPFSFIGAGTSSGRPFETSLPGLFAVGDLRSGSTKRVDAAAGEGPASVRSVHRYLACDQAIVGALFPTGDRFLERCEHDGTHRPRGPTKRHRLPRVQRVRGVVATPTALRGVRPHWVLRQLTQPARDRSRPLVRSPCHPQFRARRGLVLGLQDKRICRRSSSRTPAAPSCQPTGAGPGRTGPWQLARAFGRDMTKTAEGAEC
jgi:hypothetical protein